MGKKFYDLGVTFDFGLPYLRHCSPVIEIYGLLHLTIQTSNPNNAISIDIYTTMKKFK